MDDFNREFSQLLSDHPDNLGSDRSLRAILRDFFPTREPLIHALLAGYDLRIHEELAAGATRDGFFQSRFVSRLVKERGIQKDLADEAVRAWVTCFPRQLPPPRRPKPPKPGPEDDPLPPLRPVVPVPTEAPQQHPVPHYIPCGVGKQDPGFTISGITESPLCRHPLGSIYAVVFAYLQRSLDARPGEFIRAEEERARVALNYANVFRLQMVFLLLIKNNYCVKDTLAITYDGDPAEADAAIGNINHYARLFCALAGKPYQDVVVTMRPDSRTRVSLSPQPEGVSVANASTRRTASRLMWHGQHIKYRITDENEHLLFTLLREAFGYTHFREGQLQALREMLNNDGQHSLCIMPTGAGKSLVFYILAILQSCPTFVISPTELLIRDQLRNLKTLHGIDDAFHLPSGADYASFEPSNKLIYLTPFTFLHHQLIRKLITLNYREHMGHVVLDEVHCISNWSHDFRPEYLMLSFNLLEFVDKTGYRCFTATADYTVVRDIQRQLKIRTEDVICPVSFANRTPRFDFIQCTLDQELRTVTAAKVKELLAIKHDARKTLVFTKTESTSRALQDQIRNDHGEYVDIYRSGNPLSYVAFAQNKSSALIADADLWVGVNLPDVTDTIHLGLPISKSQFVQELGRAGRRSERDGGRATVVFIGKDAYPPDMRPFLRRTTPIDELISSCTTGSVSGDCVDAVAGITPGLEPQQAYYHAIIGVLRSVAEHVTEGRQVRFRVDPNEPLDAQAERHMRYLYVLYRVGFIHAWYIVHIAETELVFYIDPKGANPSQRSLNEMQAITADYLYDMGADQATIGAVKQSESVEETIRRYVEWHYHQFLYHHREQLLEMLDFLDVYRDRPDAIIMEALGAYFSLSLLEVQQDASKANSLTLKDISHTFKQGVDARMIESVAQTNERAYSAKLDYFLFGHRLFRFGHADTFRLARVIQNLSDVEFDELLEHIGVAYEACNERDRLLLVNALCKRADLKRVIDALYTRVDIDSVFCAVVALCANARIGA